VGYVSGPAVGPALWSLCPAHLLAPHSRLCVEHSRWTMCCYSRWRLAFALVCRWYVGPEQLLSALEQLSVSALEHLLVSALALVGNSVGISVRYFCRYLCRYLCRLRSRTDHRHSSQFHMVGPHQVKLIGRELIHAAIDR
jgi:hypothetical protein